MFFELIGYLKLNWLKSDIYLQNNTAIKRLDLINITYISCTHVCIFFNKLCKLWYCKLSKVTRNLSLP